MRLLFVIDMVKDFMEPGGVLYCGDKAREIIPVVRREIDIFHESKIGHVIYLCDSHDPNDSEFERFPAHAIKGTPGAEIIDELTPKSGDGSKVFEKTRFSGYFETGLDAYIKSLDEWYGVEEIRVCGVCTSICVMDTVADAAARGQAKISVLRNGVSDFDLKMHEFALQRMERIYGVKVV